jgi:hypothetical protein
MFPFFIKISEIFQYFLTFLRINLFKNKDILVPLSFIYFFSPVFINIFTYFTSIRWQNMTISKLKEECKTLISTNFKISENEPSTLIFAILFGFFIFEIFLQIQAFLQKKKNSVTITQRLFAIIPYVFFLVEMTYSLIDSCMLFIEAGFPKESVQQFFAHFVYPILSTYSALPGLKMGIFGWFIFYFDYYYVGRNKETFSHFVRYHYVQSMLFTSLYSFICHLYYLWVKRNPLAEINDFLGFNIFSFFLFINLICIISALIGKETQITFMDEAIQYHIGPRKKNSD